MERDDWDWPVWALKAHIMKRWETGTVVFLLFSKSRTGSCRRGHAVCASREVHHKYYFSNMHCNMCRKPTRAEMNENAQVEVFWEFLFRTSLNPLLHRLLHETRWAFLFQVYGLFTQRRVAPRNTLPEYRFLSPMGKVTIDLLATAGPASALNSGDTSLFFWFSLALFWVQVKQFFC